MALNTLGFLWRPSSVLRQTSFALISVTLLTYYLQVALFAVLGVSGTSAAQVGLILTYTSRSLLGISLSWLLIISQSLLDTSMWNAHSPDSRS